MPTTLIGLVITIAFLTPGFLYASHRHKYVPEASRTVLMETASVFTVSLASNALAGLAFATLRSLLPEHTPDVRLVADYGSGYWLDNMGYVLIWTAGLLLVSCLIAVSATSPQALAVRDELARVLGYVMDDSSAWNRTLRASKGAYVLVGLELTDGGYLRGRLDWFSTHFEETDDRDLVLAPPIELRTKSGEELEPMTAERVIVSARSIDRIDVHFIEEMLEGEKLRRRDRSWAYVALALTVLLVLVVVALAR